MNRNKADKYYKFSNNIEIGCFLRNRADDVIDFDTYFIRKNHIIGNPTDEFIDLDETTLSIAISESKIDKDWIQDYPKPKLVREKYRSVSNPLLIIYPLNPKGANIYDNNQRIKEKTIEFTIDDEPFIGFAICFPHSNGNHSEEFAINSILIDKFRQSEEEFDNNNDNPDDNE